MPVKPDPIIQEELEAMDLTIWAAIHPKQPFWNEKTGKHSQREDKSRVIVTLAGPGITEGGHGYGGSLREAVDDALASPVLRDRPKGLKGAMTRLEAALGDLRRTVLYDRLYIEQPGYDRSVAFGDLDDDIPF